MEPKKKPIFLPLCGWCNKKIRLPNKKWIAITPQTREKIGALVKKQKIELTHGLCPPCNRAATEELEEFGIE